MILKYKQKFLFILLSLFFSTHYGNASEINGQTFRYVDEKKEEPIEFSRIIGISKEETEKNKKKIEKQFNQNFYERAVTTTLSAAAIGVLGIYTCTDWLSTIPAVDGTTQRKLEVSAQDLYKLREEVTKLKKQMVIKNHSDATVRKEVKQVSDFINGAQKGVTEQLAEKNNEIYRLKQKSKPKYFAYATTDFVKSCLYLGTQSIFVSLIVGNLPTPISKMFSFWGRKLEAFGNRVYHDGDFYWFISTQTQVVQYFNELERSIELFPLASDNEERKHQKRTVLWSANCLIKELSKLIAFMEYQAEKTQALYPGYGIQMNASSRYIYRHVEKFGSKLQVMIDNRSQHAGIPAYVKSFRESLRSEQDSFCINERAALYDVS